MSKESPDTRDFVDVLTHAPTDLKTEPYDLMDGLTVELRELDAEASATVAGVAMDPASGKMDPLKATEFILANAVFYPDGHARAGEPVFTLDTVKVMRQRSGRKVAEIAEKIAEMSGLGDGAVDAAKDRFPGEPEA